MKRNDQSNLFQLGLSRGWAKAVWFLLTAFLVLSFFLHPVWISTAFQIDFLGSYSPSQLMSVVSDDGVRLNAPIFNLTVWLPFSSALLLLAHIPGLILATGCLSNLIRHTSKTQIPTWLPVAGLATGFWYFTLLLLVFRGRGNSNILLEKMLDNPFQYIVAVPVGRAAAVGGLAMLFAIVILMRKYDSPWRRPLPLIAVMLGSILVPWILFGAEILGISS